MLCPVPWVLLTIVLGAMAVVGGATHPNMGILGGVPGWARGFPYTWAASCATPVLILGLVVAGWARAMLELGRDGRVVCVMCGYRRAGLETGMACPECGAIPAPQENGRGSKSMSPQ
jgi:hypothetical protein